jgi:gliding motility-associated-like protein
VVIGAGLYRETIRVSTPNVVFIGEPGAVVSGLEPVTGTWTTHSGSIRKVSNPQTTQLFHNGQMMFEARWPNISTFDDLFERTKNRTIPSSTSTTITDGGIPANVTGAKIWLNGWYITITGRVTGQSGSTITFSPSQGDDKKRYYYYLVGKLSLLDAPNEWFWENGTLYFWGATDNVEYKARTTGFDVRGVSNVTVQNIEFIGCDPVVGDLNSASIVVDRIKARFTNHVFDVTPPSEPGVSASMGISYYNARRTGIKLLGPNSEIRNSEIHGVSSQAVWLGQNCRAVNNKVTNVGYEGNYGCAFMTWERTNGQKILRNTVTVSGRSAVDFGYVLNDDRRNMEIAYNDFSGYGCLNIDVGGIYTGGFKVTDNTVIHHNWIHDGRAELGDGVNCAVYYDMGSGPAFVHHNVFWGNNNDGFVNSNFEHRDGVVGVWYNNTFATKLPNTVYAQSYKSPDTRDIHRNNIYRDEVMLNLNQWQPDVRNSIMQNVDPQFVGTGNGGLAYQLKSTSPAINAGMVIAGITESPTPDAGAYEYGVAPWTPGYVPAPGINLPSPNIAPTVTLTAPNNNAQVPAGSNITVSATASDSDGSVTKVEFYNGNTKLGEDTSSPYTFAWNNVVAGNYTLTARATDNQNATKTSSAVNITVTNSNVVPSVNITAPSNNATYTVGENITIIANATDADGTVAKVEFYNGNTKLGEDLTNPYNFVLTGASEGTYNITARAYDNQNASASSSIIRINITRSNSSPTVVLTGPVNNTSMPAPSNMTLTANASDSDGTVNKVEFYSGTTKLGEDMTSPYTFVWTNVPPGNYSLSARATDNLNAVGVSAVVGVSVVAPNTPPNVSITGPANNSSVLAGNNVTITATANDPGGSIARVEFYRGNTKLGEDTTSPYSFVWQNVAAGTYTLTARAYDNQNATRTSSAITITAVPNSPPVIQITGPANNAYFAAGDNITITAAASDSDGTITRVEFFNGNNKIGEDLTSPYSYVWNNVPRGNHTLTARVTDNQNARTTSSPVKINAVDPEPPTIFAVNDIVISLPTNSTPLQAGGRSEDGSDLDFSWSQVSGPNQAIFSNPSAAETTVSGLTEGGYVFQVTATDGRGLKSTYQVRVTVGEAPVTAGMIPRFFTPNDDGVNDHWEWPSTALLDNAVLMIFNRLGQKVYEAFPYDNSWDGKLDGRPLEADAYYYIIRLLDQVDIKGAVRIVR